MVFTTVEQLSTLADEVNEYLLDDGATLCIVDKDYLKTIHFKITQIVKYNRGNNSINISWPAPNGADEAFKWLEERTKRLAEANSEAPQTVEAGHHGSNDTKPAVTAVVLGKRRADVRVNMLAVRPRKKMKMLVDYHMEHLLGLLEGRPDWYDLEEAVELLKCSILAVDAGAGQKVLDFHMRRVTKMVQPDTEEVKESLELLSAVIDFRHANSH